MPRPLINLRIHSASLLEIFTIMSRRSHGRRNFSARRLSFVRLSDYGISSAHTTLRSGEREKKNASVANVLNERRRFKRRIVEFHSPALKIRSPLALCDLLM